MKCMLCVAALALAGCGGSMKYDPASTYWVQVVSAEIDGTDGAVAWDVDNSPPDAQVFFTCAGGDSGSSDEQETYTPAWSTGTCVATGADFLNAGINWRMDDIDITTPDVIVPTTQTVFTQADIEAREATVPSAGRARNIRFRFGPHQQ